MSDNIEGLERLLEKTEEFTQEAFDWVIFLGKASFLQELYDFKSLIEFRIKEEKKNAKEAEIQDTDEA